MGLGDLVSGPCPVALYLRGVELRLLERHRAILFGACCVKVVFRARKRCACGSHIGIVGRALRVSGRFLAVVCQLAELALRGVSARSSVRLFADGALSNLSNPKIAIFYFAFLPQFVPAGAAHPTLSMLALGLVFAGLTFLVKAPVGLFAGMLSGWLRARPRALVWLHRASGAVLVGLGVRLAMEPRP